MAALIPRNSESGLTAGDWSHQAPGSPIMNPGTPISGPNNSYTFAGNLIVTINDNGGPPAEVRYCRTNDFEANFILDEAVIVAPGSGNAASPDQTSIRLSLSQPVRAIGCRVAGTESQGNLGVPFTAVMYAKRSGAALWEPAIKRAGVLDSVIQPGSTQGRAPFVGARDTAGPSIVEVCFDVQVMPPVNFAQVAIATLYYQL